MELDRSFLIAPHSSGSSYQQVTLNQWQSWAYGKWCSLEADKWSDPHDIVLCWAISLNSHGFLLTKSFQILMGFSCFSRVPVSLWLYLGLFLWWKVKTAQPEEVNPVEYICAVCIIQTVTLYWQGRPNKQKPTHEHEHTGNGHGPSSMNMWRYTLCISLQSPWLPPPPSPWQLQAPERGTFQCVTYWSSSLNAVFKRKSLSVVTDVSGR